MGIAVLEGRASFVDPHHIGLNGRTLSSRKFIVAVGTRPSIPPVPGLKDLDYHTNETLLELDNLPRSLIVLGGGVAGMEFASACGRLGVKTTVIEAGPRILAMADREPAARLHRALAADGITILTGVRADQAGRLGDEVFLRFHDSDGRAAEVRAEKILVAAGRRPDMETLNLERAGVTSTGRGITTDDTLRTSAPNIYACGDVTGPYQLASMAEYQGILAGSNASLPVKQRVDYSNNVYVVYTEPTLAFLGLTEEGAHRRYGHMLRVYRFDYADMRRALTDDLKTGVAKLLCDPGGYLIGAHILGEAAGEVIHEIQAIRAMGVPLHRLHGAIHAYPSYSQAIVGRASQLAYLDRMGRNIWVGAALGILPGCSNHLALARERLAEGQTISEKADALAEAGRRVRQEQTRSMEARVKGTACTIGLPPLLLDHEESPVLGACAWAGIPNPSALILDLGRVQKMNGLGAAMVVKIYALCDGQNRSFAVINLPQGLREAFRVIGLHRATGAGRGDQGVQGKAGRDEGKNGEPNRLLLNGDNWAPAVDRLAPLSSPHDARNLNVRDRRIAGPLNGFGQLWQKVFTLHLPDFVDSPQRIIRTLKENFCAFQPAYNRFFPSDRGLLAGEIIPLDSRTPGGPISTGVVVLYADETSFTFITPEGHPEAGMITFTADRVEEKSIVRIVGLARAGDPLYEAAFLLVGSRLQTRIWHHVLTSLAIHLGVPADITVDSRLVDGRRCWSKAPNLWQNAQVRTLLAEPARWPAALSRLLNLHRGEPRLPARTTPL